MTNKEHINQIIEETFITLNKIDKNKPNSSRLIFPTYRGEMKVTRYCEQELRFVFVETFNKYCRKHKLGWLYSVETPTIDTYSGFSGNALPTKDPNGQSAMIDLVIHDKNRQRIALIEFKANQVSKTKFDKDFKKLQNEPEGLLRYFVMYVIAPNPRRALNALKRKIGSKDSNTTFVCYDLLHAEYLIDERKKV